MFVSILVNWQLVSVERKVAALNHAQEKMRIAQDYLVPNAMVEAEPECLQTG